MQTILVTGGAGFIGRWFVAQQLKSEDVRVINVDKLTYAGTRASLPELSNRHIFYHNDICDREFVRELLQRYRPHSVINFAAESHVDRSIDSPDIFVQTNIVGTASLLAESLAYWQRLETEQQAEFRFLQVSTDEVFGSAQPGTDFVEESAYAPNSPYSASKASADLFARAYHRTYGFPSMVANCSNNYGPFQYPEKLIPLAVVNAIQKKPIPVYGSGMATRDWIYVEDHCEALSALLLAGVPGESYLIGAQEERSVIEIVETVCRMVDVELARCPNESRELVRHVRDRPGHDMRYGVDTSKIRRATDWKPKTSFSTGIEKTIQWYCRNTQWVESVAIKTDSR